MVKARIMAGVGENEMVRLSFTRQATKTQLRWEHAKEFEYKGEMYDIVKSEEKGDSMVYWCIWDKAETQINRQMDALIAAATGSDRQHRECLDHIFSFLKSLFHYPGKAHHPATAAAHEARFFYGAPHITFIEIPPFPPPEV